MGFNSGFKVLIWWCGCIYYQVLASVCLLHCSEPDLKTLRMVNLSLFRSKWRRGRRRRGRRGRGRWSKPEYKRFWWRVPAGSMGKRKREPSAWAKLYPVIGNIFTLYPMCNKYESMSCTVGIIMTVISYQIWWIYLNGGFAMAQAVSHWPLEAKVQSQACQCGICGG